MSLNPSVLVDMPRLALDQRAGSALRSLAESAKTGDQTAVAKASQEFESLLLREMIKSMRNTVPEGVFEKGLGTDIFTSMLDEELSRQAASSSPLGLAKVLQEQMGAPIAHPTGTAAGVGGASVGETELLGDGSWVQPLVRLPRVAAGQAYGAERDGIRPAACGAGHCGTDYADTVGTVVHAVRRGVVARVDRDPGGSAGRQLTIRHQDGFVSRYLHLDSVAAGLAAGTPVTGGMPIGKMGNSGSASRGSHLHFELSRTGRRIDVEPFAPRWAVPTTQEATEDLTQGVGQSVDEGTVAIDTPMGPSHSAGKQVGGLE